MHLRNGESGFSLAELVIVLFVVMVLVCLAIPFYAYELHEAQYKACVTNQINMNGAAEIYKSFNYRYPASIDELKTSGYLKKDAYCPASGEYTIDCQTGRIQCSRHPFSGKY